MGDAETLEMVIEARNEAADALRQVASQTGEMKSSIAADVNELNNKFQEMDTHIQNLASMVNSMMIVMSSSSKDMASATKGSAEDAKKAFRETAGEADLASKMVGDAVTKMGGNVAKARSHMARLKAGVDESGKGTGYATKALNNLIQKADRLPSGMMEGMRLITSNGAQLAKDISQVVQRGLGMLTSGNFVQAGIFAAAAVYGAWSRKGEEAAKEKAKLDQEALKAAEKSAEELKKVYEKSVTERKNLDQKYSMDVKSLEFKMRAFKDENFDAEKAMARETYRTKQELVQKEIGDTFIAYQKASQEAAKPSRTKEEGEHKKAAEEAARLNWELARGNKILAEREYTLGRQNAAFERMKQAAADHERIMLASMATLRGMVNERGKLEESIEKTAEREMFTLGLDKEQRQYAGDLLQIENLRGQGFERQARLMELVLNAKRMYVAYDKAQAEVEAARKNREAGESELASLAAGLERAADLQGQVNALAEKYVKLINKGVDATKASEVYHKEVAQLIEKEVTRASAAVGAAMAQTAEIDKRLQFMLKEEQVAEQIVAAHKKGHIQEEAAAKVRQVMLQFEEEAELRQMKRLEEVTKLRASGTKEEMEALKKRYDLEDKIHNKRKDSAVAASRAETGTDGAPKSARDFLAQQGISVSVSGGKTKTDYGIQKRRDEDARAKREENLARERGWNPQYEEWMANQKKKAGDEVANAPSEYNNDWVMEGAGFKNMPSIEDLKKTKPPALGGGSSKASPEQAAGDAAKAAGDAAAKAGEIAGSAAASAAAMEALKAAMEKAAGKADEAAGSAQQGATSATSTNTTLTQLAAMMAQQTAAFDKMTGLMKELEVAQKDASNSAVRAMPLITSDINQVKTDLANLKKAMDDAVKALNGG